MIRALRIASVFAPPLLAAVIASRASGSQLEIVGGLLLAWMAMVATLLVRFREARIVARRVAGAHRRDVWRHVDALTGSGRAMMWLGLAAIASATLTQWASLSVIGVLGLGSACLTVTWTAFVAGGDRPWRAARIAREILPRHGTEGDLLREEVQLAGIQIPAGMRLFIEGRATRHGVVTRYVVGSEGSTADVRLESDLGPAPRGDHRVPPLALWLGDVLGLSRTPIVELGEAEFSAVPRPSRVDGVQRLLADGRDDAMTRPTHRMPTEGTFRIREYAAGDDTRRIHWVRSLQVNQLVVRLPDEIPQADPEVRLVLDTCLEGTASLTCTAHEELLDAMTRVWLGIGNALAAAGSRVTLVTAIGKAEAIAPIERPLVARASRAALRLGARVDWQSVLPLRSLLLPGGKQIVVTCRPRPADVSPEVTWVVVPELAWTAPSAWPTSAASWLRLPFPSGSAENREARRRKERKRVLTMWDHRAQFSGTVGWINWRSCTGSYVARPVEDRVALEVIR